MEICRKSIATVLLLFIYLLTLRIGDAVAGRNDTKVEDNRKIILEEVIISGSGDDTRVTADAVAEDATTIGDQILSLLSKREIRRSGRSKQTSSNLDQDTAQSRTVIVDVNDEDNLERLKHVIAKYEPQRTTSRKTKRKIVNGAHDVLHAKATGSTTDLERAYDEVLRNISQRAPELTSSNVGAILNPYLSQTRKNLRKIYIPEATILPAKDDKAQKSHPDADFSYTSPTLKEKKTKKLLKKYLQLNRTVTLPRGSPIEESRFNKEIADSNESNTPGRYFKLPNGKTKPKNESLSIEPSSNIYSKLTEEPENRREWNIQDSLVQTISPFIPQSNNNNSYNLFNANNLNNLNFPNTVQLLSKYNRMPRPFSVLRSPDSPVIEIPYKKPSPSPVSFNRQQVARSSANVLPLILPTETLFNTPSARRYVAINHLKPEEDSTTLVNTEASPPTSPASERTTFADYDVSYTDIISTTKSPLVTINDQRRISSSDYYAITETPAEQIATRTDPARLIHIPSQTSASYTVQQEKNPQAVRRDGFLSRITAYNDPKDEKSNLNANAGLALYNKFASVYSTNEPNVFNVSRAVTQNYQNFRQPVQSSHAVTSQQVSTPLYATLKPISTPLLKNRPIASAKSALAPYYNSGLLISRRKEGEKLNDNKINAENVEINESRLADADESNAKVADNENNFGNHKAQINNEAYKSYKTSNEQREKEDREEEDKEDRYQQPKRNYQGYQDKHHEYDKDNKDDKNDDKREKYNVRHKDNKDEKEDADEKQEDEYVDTEKDEDQPNHSHRYQYNKHKYDRDDSEEEDKQRNDRKKYDKENNRRDEHDHETDVKHKFLSINKYFDGPQYSDYESREPNEKYRERYDRKKLSRDKKNRDEDSEETFAEDKLIARHSKDELARRQREEYKKKQSKDDKTTQKRKHHRHHQATPRRDSHHEEHRHEEYDETNPKQVREEYRHLRQHVKDDNPRHDSENDNEKTHDHEHGETQEHAHKHKEHHKKKKDGGDHEFEEGGSAEHKEEHHGHDGEKGHKGYKVWHEHEKAEKGHHDKEHASKEYDEKDGEEKKHEEEGGFHKEHHRGEAGKKSAEFGEKGEHKKGHSTHGEHSVHKKDEYEKKTEFFDEFHEDGDVKKHGEHHHEHESKKGGHEKKGHHDAADHEQKYGKEEKHEKGGHHHEHKGHKIDEGDDHHYDHDEKYGKKEGHEHGKKWSFKKGDNGDHAGDGHNR